MGLCRAESLYGCGDYTPDNHLSNIVARLNVQQIKPPCQIYVLAEFSNSFLEAILTLYEIYAGKLFYIMIQCPNPLKEHESLRVRGVL